VSQSLFDILWNKPYTYPELFESSHRLQESPLNHKRNVYLQMKPLADARKIVWDAFIDAVSLETVKIPTPEAVGRILSGPLTAAFSSPNYHAAAMDGIALSAKITFGAHASRPKVLRTGSDAIYVNTGHVMPAGTDAVIMIEQVQVLDDERVQIEAPAFPWQHVRKMGEDIVATEQLFARHHCVTPYCIGALLSAGIGQVEVFRRPKLVMIPTGSELVDWRTTPTEKIRPGQVIESNTEVLSALAAEAGGRCERLEKIDDDPAAIQRAVLEAVKDDTVCAVLITGGSSAGSEDFSRAAIAAEGEVLVHGVTMMPGKPVIVGNVSAKPVFGIPGYPVSAIMAFEQLVAPLIAGWLGQPELRRPRISVTPTRKIASKLGVEEFVRVKIGRVDRTLVATALPRGAGQITSITEADGMVRIPAHLEGVGADDQVTAELLRPLELIDRTLVVVGSHDNTLDLLADELRAQTPHLSLTSSHVGSMGGLMAVKRGVCHMAGVHLLDENDGTYNISHVQKYLKGMDVRLVHLTMRDQGLMVLPGNPKGIRGMEDLVRTDVRLINRQAGSGTRILLDYRLKQLGISPDQIDGYPAEEFTHMAVAVAVLSGAADVGLGIHAAARALGLDFLPVVTEQYDLVVPADFFCMANMQTFLQVIRTDAFKRRVSALGGYDTGRTGKILL
jgi:putative molybdopterin biosynthesis protein